MNCPVCKSSIFIDTLRLSNLPTISNALHKTKYNAINCDKSDIALVECTSCQHIYNTNFNNELINYDNNYHNSLFCSSRFNQEANLIAEDIVNTFNVNDKSILEVACGEGDFSRLLNTYSPVKIMAFDQGLEINNHKNDSIVFSNSSIETFNTTEKVDVLIARHFLEHLSSFDVFFSFLNKHCNTNCFVYIEVPNADYMLNEFSLSDVIYEHPQYFGKKSLCLLFEQNDFEIIKINEYFDQQFLGLFLRRGFQSRQDIAGNRINFSTFIKNCNEKINAWNKSVNAISDKNNFLWGAGAKGISFLNMIKYPELIQEIIDINPVKQGCFTAGTGHEIISVKKLIELKPDNIFIANKNYYHEIELVLRQNNLSCELQII